MAKLIAIRWSSPASMAAECKVFPPWIIMPSSVGVTSQPNNFKFSVTVRIRSVSFTLSSAASRIMVIPSAKAAITAITGISSIKVGMSSPSTTVPWSELPFTRRSQTGSPDAVLGFSRSMAPPIALAAFKMPSLVGLTPTLRIKISEPGVSNAAAIK